MVKKKNANQSMKSREPRRRREIKQVKSIKTQFSSYLYFFSYFYANDLISLEGLLPYARGTADYLTCSL